MAGDRAPLSQRRDAILRQALATLNAPRPRALDAETLTRLLVVPDPRWRPHMEALVDEVPVETLHGLVLAGLTTFEALSGACRLWKLEGAHVDWIEEMARLGLARSARTDPAHH